MQAELEPPAAVAAVRLSATSLLESWQNAALHRGLQRAGKVAVHLSRC